MAKHERSLSARREGPPGFHPLLTTCCRWRPELLNYFRWRYTNGFTEGMNNRSKAIKRRGYGYRNRDNLRHLIMLSTGERSRRAA